MNSRLKGWEFYPVSVGRREADTDNVKHYQEELNTRSSDLFTGDPSTTKLELFETCSGRDLRTSPNLKTAELKSLLATSTEATTTRIFLISQHNSWSRLKITEAMFKLLCHFYAISPRFIDLVIGFSKKKSSCDENFMGCYGRTFEENVPGSERQRSFELFYNLRHYELHGRDLKDPWSCRHTAIHQKYYPEDGQSSWVIIQSPKAFRENLESFLSDLSTREPLREEHPLILHLRYLKSSGVNLRMYLNYISEELTTLDRKVTLFQTNVTCDVDFLLSQDLQTIRRKLASALSIIEGTISTVQIISEESDALQSVAKTEPRLQQAFQRELRYVLNNLQYHISMVKKLMGFSEDISRLNHKILGILSEKLLHENGLVLSRIATSEHRDNKKMMEHADKVYKDSRTSLFSTGLIEYDQASSWIGVKGQIWIAVVTTVVLAFATLVAAMFWDRRERKDARTSAQTTKSVI